MFKYILWLAPGLHLKQFQGPLFRLKTHVKKRLICFSHRHRFGLWNGYGFLYRIDPVSLFVQRFPTTSMEWATIDEATWRKNANMVMTFAVSVLDRSAKVAWRRDGRNNQRNRLHSANNQEKTQHLLYTTTTIRKRFIKLRFCISTNGCLHKWAIRFFSSNQLNLPFR